MSGGDADKRSIYALRSSTEGGGNCGTLSTISTQRFPKVAISTSLIPRLLNFESCRAAQLEDAIEVERSLDPAISTRLQAKTEWKRLKVKISEGFRRYVEWKEGP